MTSTISFFVTHLKDLKNKGLPICILLESIAYREVYHKKCCEKFLSPLQIPFQLNKYINVLPYLLNSLNAQQVKMNLIWQRFPEKRNYHGRRHAMIEDILHEKKKFYHPLMKTMEEYKHYVVNIGSLQNFSNWTFWLNLPGSLLHFPKCQAFRQLKEHMISEF